MKKVELFDGTKDYVYPTGYKATPEDIKKRFPAVLETPHYVITDERGEMLWSLQSVPSGRSIYNVNPVLTTEEALREIELQMNKEVEQAPDSFERIAAALEFQNLQSM